MSSAKKQSWNILIKKTQLFPAEKPDIYLNLLSVGVTWRTRSEAGW